MISISNIVIGIIKSLFTGVLLLLLGVYLIPHGWTIKIIKTLKPSLLKDFFKKNDKYFNSILSILIDGNFTDNFSDDIDIKDSVNEIKSLKSELEKIEKNMFTIDLLSDLFKTLQFSAINYSMSTAEQVIDNICNYFSNYSMRLFETSYRRNFADDILKKFNEMVDLMRETKEFESDDKLGIRFTKQSRGNYSQGFESYLGNEKIQLSETRKLVLNSIKLKAIHLMDNAK